MIRFAIRTISYKNSFIIRGTEAQFALLKGMEKTRADTSLGPGVK